MIGIEAIGQYLPAFRERNEDIHDDKSIIEKIGIFERAIKSKEETVLEMCLQAFEDLKRQTSSLNDLNDIGMLILVTQSPDINIPHTSSMIHGAIELSENCACFDVSLGCSGFVYGLSIVKSFMESNQINKALLFTCDPYSKIVDRNDVNTKLIFGDAASVTLLSNLNPIFEIEKFTFGTQGKKGNCLTIEKEKLFMDGRSIFNFVATKVPHDIQSCLDINKVRIEAIDKFILHPGSKYMLDTLVRRMKLDVDKVPFLVGDYGNTVSSSIPLVLRNYLNEKSIKRILLSGFGVGLSWASNILKRVE
jgi:3-oxoacyl-[acyl-carrier-protein] synthase-3